MIEVPKISIYSFVCAKAYANSWTEFAPAFWYKEALTQIELSTLLINLFVSEISDFKFVNQLPVFARLPMISI